MLRFIGNADIGGAWGVIEECDWVAMINLERSVKTNQMYLTIKNTKHRMGKDPTISDYFNHPFCVDNELRLETDEDKEAPVSVLMLSSDIESVNTEELEDAPQERPKYKATSISSDEIMNKMMVTDGVHVA